MSRFISRRRFFEDSLFGITAAAGAAYAFSATTIAQQTAAGDKIGVAIIGSGSRAKEQMKAYMGNDRCAILYVADPDSSQMPDKLIDDIASTQ